MNAQGRSEGRRWRGLVARLAAMAGAVVLAAGCLGQDYKSIELSLSEWSTGWQATVEPDEQFSVGLRPLRLHPEAQWDVSTVDPSIVEPVEQFVDDPAPEEPDAVAMQVFVFRAVRPGTTELSFEASAAGERVAVADYSVSVVADACGAGVGETAARCRAPMPRHARGWTEWDHERAVQVGLDQPTELTLTSPALYPGAQWQAVEVDTSLLDVGTGSAGAVRTPGDFDNQDTAKPDSFVPVWSYPVQGVAVGETDLTFEAVQGGRQVDVARFTVRVVEAVDEGDYLVRPDER